ncbi:MAG: hypothetical protein ACRD0L_14695 [Acidimicrobiales bacterium]
MADPKLAKVSVTFQTTDDDKREESILDLQLLDKTDNLVARASDSWGKFENNTTNGPFSLTVLDPVALSDLKPGGTFRMAWTPWHDDTLGNSDEWHFNLFADLVFSDDEHVVVDENKLKMGYNYDDVLTFGL